MAWLPAPWGALAVLSARDVSGLFYFLGVVFLCACIFEKKMPGLCAWSRVALEEGAAAAARTVRTNGCPSREGKGPCVFHSGVHLPKRWRRPRAAPGNLTQLVEHGAGETKAFAVLQTCPETLGWPAARGCSASLACEREQHQYAFLGGFAGVAGRPSSPCSLEQGWAGHTARWSCFSIPVSIDSRTLTVLLNYPNPIAKLSAWG